MVREGGDEAVRRLTRRLDGVDVDDARVPQSELESALGLVAPTVREAIQLLAANLRRPRRPRCRPPPARCWRRARS